MKNLVIKALLFLCMFTGLAFGQKDGVPTFGTADSHDYDTVDLITLNPTINITSPANGGITMSSQQGCYVYNNTLYCRPYATSSAFFGAFIPDMIGTISWSASTACGGSGENNLQYVSFDALDRHSFGSAMVAEGGVGCHQSVTAVAVDNSGYTLSINWQGNGTLTAPNGTVATVSLFSVYSGSTDSFGNTTSFTLANPNVYTNKQGVVQKFHQVDTLTNSPEYISYTDTTGATRQITFTRGAAKAINFAPCAAYALDTATVYPISQIQFPDGINMNITMESGYQGSGITGRIGSFTLRTGGIVSYTYDTPCNSSNIFTSHSITRTTPDGITSYSTVVGSQQWQRTTTVLDPGNNKKVYYFVDNAYLVGVDSYQNNGTVTSPSYTLFSSDTFCYNANTTNCRTTHVTVSALMVPVTQRDTYHYVGSFAMSHTTQMFDTYGNITSSSVNDYVTGQTLTTTMTYGSSCGPNTSINNLPCDVLTTDGTYTLSESKFTYNANGALLSNARWTGTQWLTSTSVPNTNGTVASSNNENGQPTTYSYSGICHGLIPTSSSTTINGVVLSTSQTFDCNGGVVLTTTDENGNTPPATQYDSMFRPTLVTDNMGYQVSTTYTNATSGFSQASFGSSIQQYNWFLDTLGRTIRTQIKQGPSSSNFDTVSRTYGFNGTFLQTSTSTPCTQTFAQDCASATYDLLNAFGRPVSTSDPLGGVLVYAYYLNDSSVTVGPAPAGENPKRVQIEVDGFGRTKSVCNLGTVVGAVACGQAMGNSGILDSYGYAYNVGQTIQTITRGVQSHFTTLDGLNRKISSSTPEQGLISNTYDLLPSGMCGVTNSPGDLMQTTFANGTSVCYLHDNLHRLTDSSTNAIPNVCRRFRYDSSLAPVNSMKPSDYPTSGANIVGRLVEAETDNCGTPLLTSTDEWFAYDKDGRMTDMWESTPHSGGYYHTWVTYNPNGTVASINGIPGYTAYTFGVDGEGRTNSAVQGASTFINGVTFDAAGRPLTAPIGTSGDNDTFTYDAVERMKTYTFSVNGKVMSGTLTWNPNGTLGQLVISDTFNAGGAQTCAFAYDDVARLTDDNCGSSLWHQTFGYDQYNNLTKTGNPGTSWSPGYNAATNGMIGSSYDGAGYLKYDGVNTYTWDGYNKMKGVRAGTTAAICGTSGSCPTYDAFGRIVEVKNNGSTKELLFGPTGRLSQMSGQIVTETELPLPGGLTLKATGTGGTGGRYYMHKDWLGSNRLMTNYARAFSWEAAYTPYGETYDVFGNTTKLQFTGDFQDIFAGLYDTTPRELATNASRWLSPDLLTGFSWNAYSYPTNPNSETDPNGLAETPLYSGDGYGMVYFNAMGSLSTAISPQAAADQSSLSIAQTQFLLAVDNVVWDAEADIEGEPMLNPNPTAGAPGCGSYNLGCNAPALQTVRSNELVFNTPFDPAGRLLLGALITATPPTCTGEYTCAGVKDPEEEPFIGGNGWFELIDSPETNWFGSKTGVPKNVSISVADRAIARATGADVHEVYNMAKTYEADLAAGRTGPAIDRMGKILNAFANGETFQDAVKANPYTLDADDAALRALWGAKK